LPVANIALDQHAQQMLTMVVRYRIGCFSGHSEETLATAWRRVKGLPQSGYEYFLSEYRHRWQTR